MTKKNKMKMIAPEIAPDNQGYVAVYTDGGRMKYRCGTILCSIGVYFSHRNNANVSKIVPSEDNNVAEAMASLKAIEIAKYNKIRKLKIFTDSQCTINLVNSLKSQQSRLEQKQRRTREKNLRKHGKLYEKSPVTFEQIVQLSNMMEDVKFVWVKGHSKLGVPGRAGNKAADRLASQALKRAAAATGLIK